MRCLKIGSFEWKLWMGKRKEAEEMKEEIWGKRGRVAGET
jgi:hypothetical protein